MTAKRKSRAKAQEAPPLFDFEDKDVNETERVCEWEGCSSEGSHRAPKSREELNTYRWFCLDHVREYNKSWNYYEGMSESEVEADLRHDTVWNRPTWQLGSNLGPDAINGAHDPFGIFNENGADPHGATDHKKNGHDGNGTPIRPPISAEEERAYRTLDLEYPVSAEDVKSRYKSLVKEHHPDANEGAKDSEERIKEINEAYSVIRATLNA